MASRCSMRLFSLFVVVLALAPLHADARAMDAVDGVLPMKRSLLPREKEKRVSDTVNTKGSKEKDSKKLSLPTPPSSPDKERGKQVEEIAAKKAALEEGGGKKEDKGASPLPTGLERLEVKAEPPSCEGKAATLEFYRHASARMEGSAEKGYTLLGFKAPDVRNMKFYNTETGKKQLPKLVYLDIYKDMTWKKAKETMNEADLRAYGAYRQLLVNTLLVTILSSTCPACEFGITGSDKPKSDYDVSIRGPAGDSAVRQFNCEFETAFGITSSDKFDANIYAASFLENVESWQSPNHKPKCMRVLQGHEKRMWIHLSSTERADAVMTQYVMAMAKLQYFTRQFLQCPTPFDPVAEADKPKPNDGKKPTIVPKDKQKEKPQEDHNTVPEEQLLRRHKEEVDGDEKTKKEREQAAKHRCEPLLKVFNRFMYHADTRPEAKPKTRRRAVSTSSYFVDAPTSVSSSGDDTATKARTLPLVNRNPVMDPEGQTAAGQKLLQVVWERANAELYTMYTEPCKDARSAAACKPKKFPDGSEVPVFDMSNKAWRNELYARKLQIVYDLYRAKTFQPDCHMMQRGISVARMYGIETYWSVGAYLHVVAMVQEKMTDMRLPRSVFLDSFLENLGGTVEVLIDMQHEEHESDLAKVIELSKYENRLADAALIMYSDVKATTDVKIQTGASSMNEAATCLKEYTTEMKDKIRGNPNFDKIRAKELKDKIVSCHQKILDALGSKSPVDPRSGVEHQIFNVLMALAEDVVSVFFKGAASSAWRDTEVQASEFRPLWEDAIVEGHEVDDEGLIPPHGHAPPPLPPHGGGGSGAASASSGSRPSATGLDAGGGGGSSASSSTKSSGEVKHRADGSVVHPPSSSSSSSVGSKGDARPRGRLQPTLPTMPEF